MCGGLPSRQRKGKAQIAKSHSSNRADGAAGPDFFGIAYILIAESVIAFADGVYYFDTLLNGLYERAGHALVKFGGTAKKASYRGVNIYLILLIAGIVILLAFVAVASPESRSHTRLRFSRCSS